MLFASALVYGIAQAQTLDKSRIVYRFEQPVHRQLLSAEAQRACHRLDQQLPLLKAAEAQAATDAAKAHAEVRLFRARKSFKDLRR